MNLGSGGFKPEVSIEKLQAEASPPPPPITK